jgi:hypothetical protein
LIYLLINHTILSYCGYYKIINSANINDVILEIMSVSTFKTAVILYVSDNFAPFNKCLENTSLPCLEPKMANRSYVVWDNSTRALKMIRKEEITLVINPSTQSSSDYHLTSSHFLSQDININIDMCESCNLWQAQTMVIGKHWHNETIVCYDLWQVWYRKMYIEEGQTIQCQTLWWKEIQTQRCENTVLVLTINN